MKKWEQQLMQHILNEKYLGEEDQPKMQKADRKSFLQSVANYHRLGEMVYRNSALTEVTETLNNIVEQAEVLTMQESEHWFDNVTVSRHMKQLKEAYKVFEKTATEMNGLQQRLESAYDDMGTVLNRYYKVGNAISEDSYTAGVDDEGPALEENINEARVSGGDLELTLKFPLEMFKDAVENMDMELDPDLEASPSMLKQLAATMEDDLDSWFENEGGEWLENGIDQNVYDDFLNV